MKIDSTELTIDQSRRDALLKLENKLRMLIKQHVTFYVKHFN